MLKEKALRKIFLTTLTMFLILTVYTIPTTSKNNVLRTNLEIEDISSINTNKVYLLDNNNYLIEVDIFLENNSLEDKIKKIIDYLTIDNNTIPSKLNGYIPKNTKLLDLKINDKEVILNFSKEFKNDEIIITGITYSLIELKEIESITIQAHKEWKDAKIAKENAEKAYIDARDKYINRLKTSDKDKYTTYEANMLKTKKDRLEIELKDKEKDLAAFKALMEQMGKDFGKTEAKA